MIILYKYLALYKKLVLPGIGNFTIEESPANLQFTDKLLSPPAKEIIFTTQVLPLDNHFYSFLANELKVDKITAVRLYNQETGSIKKQLEQDGKATLTGIGTLQKQDDTIMFMAAEGMPEAFVPLHAERVIHKNATHTILVGETEVTNTKMQEALEYTNENPKDYWWLYALILAILALFVIAVYYSNK